MYFRKISPSTTCLYSAASMLLRQLVRRLPELRLEAEVAANDQCDFGKWLNGEGKGLLDGASYQQIHKLHTEFHKIAGEVVRKVERGDVAGGKAAIEKTGEFGKASAVLTAAMMAARDKAA
jgi:hypothetical protein